MNNRIEMTDPELKLKRYEMVLQVSDDGETWTDARDTPGHHGIFYMGGVFYAVEDALACMVTFTHQGPWLLDGNYAYPNDQTLFKNIRRERWEICEVAQ